MPFHIADDYDAIRERQAELRPAPATGEDAEILTLFRDWRATHAEIDRVCDDGGDDDVDDDVDELCERVHEIEEAIFERGGGQIGRAIRIFLYFRTREDRWTLRSGQFRLDPVLDREHGDWLAKLLREAASVAPVIRPYIEAIIDDDADLIDAEMTIARAEKALCQPRLGYEGEGFFEEIIQERNEALNLIAETEAKTPRGEAIKAWAAEKAEMDGGAA